MSVYDISTTDPADILRNDIIAQNESVLFLTEEA
jgi:hypothetical protein